MFRLDWSGGQGASQYAIAFFVITLLASAPNSERVELCATERTFNVPGAVLPPPGCIDVESQNILTGHPGDPVTLRMEMNMAAQALAITEAAASQTFGFIDVRAEAVIVPLTPGASVESDSGTPYNGTTAVPEPGTVSLIGVGSAAIGFLQRRRA
jgi:hypothetical protein